MPQPVQQRAWGTRFDTLPSSPLISLRKDTCPPQSFQSMGDTSFADCSVTLEGHASNKVVHDASIFVGSLPSNVDQIELGHLLSEHLSSYPEEKSIKAVRDSKGGTCAFIQCKDPHAAARLLEAFHEHPVPAFLGRHLRFEPAKACRTLYVSYRAPISRGVNDGKPAKHYRGVELELPTAMKLTKSVDAKFPIVLYNSEATTAAETEDHSADDYDALSQNISDLYLCPVRFDAETLRKIAEFFGPLEHFAKPVFPRSEEGHAVAVDESERRSYNLPPPHNTLRSAGMDAGCWEIKWRTRNDSISAHSTLRRVPHLNVSWAHHSALPSFQNAPSSSHQTHTPSNYQKSMSNNSHGFGTQEQTCTSQRLVSSAHAPSHVEEQPGVLSEQPVLTNISNSLTISRDSLGEGRTPAQKAAHQHRPRALSLNNVAPSRSKLGLEFDHRPPLGYSIDDSLDEHPLWDDDTKNTCHESLSVIESASSIHETYRKDPGCPSSRQDTVTHVNSPDFESTSLSPATAMSTTLRTPTTGSYLEDFQDIGTEYRKARVVDPTAIFVGGLEPFGANWDENRVAQLFSKYGTIEDVKLIRPANQRSAFAFVKYNNVDSPGQAIKGEHNRIIDGRPIRVQLRTCNPHARMPWKNAPDKLKATITDMSIMPLSLGSMRNANQQPCLYTVTDRPVTEPVNTFAQEVYFHNSEADILGTSRHKGAKEKGQFQRPYSASRSVDGDQRSPSPHATQVAAAVTSPSQPTSRSSPSIIPATGTGPVSSVRYPQVPEWSTIPQHNAQQLPLYGSHPLYPYPPPVVYPRTSGSNSPQPGFQASTAPPGTNGLYFPFVPYPGHAAVTAQGQASLHLSVHSQAPIMPTGFIQGDQGVLVPVYPPEALNKYMSNQDLPPQLSRASEGSLSSSPKAVPGTSAPLWRPYAHPVPVYSSPAVYGSAYQPPHGPLHSLAWTNHASQSQHWHSVVTHPQNVTTTMGYPGPVFPKQNEVRGPLPRRQYRKDLNQSYKHGGNRTPTINRFNRVPAGSLPAFGSHSYSGYPRESLPRDGWPR